MQSIMSKQCRNSVETGNNTEMSAYSEGGITLKDYQ